jgi:hypothetical protein
MVDGRDLYANWCDDAIEPGEPEPQQARVLPVISGELEIIGEPPAPFQGGSLTLRASDLVIDIGDGKTHTLGDIEIDESTAEILVPAAVMPVPTQIGSMVGDDHQMKRARRNRPVAAGTEVGLPRRIWLDRRNGDFVHQPKIAHPTTTRVAKAAMTTMAMSSAVFVWGRNGFSPIGQR